MSKRRRKEITVETSLLVLRRARRHAPVYCAACPSPVPLLTPDEAAALAGVSTRTLYRWVEAERIHFTETPAGRLLVCPHSLTLLTGKEPTS
jgi:excisionase family DNA binding protein